MTNRESGSKLLTERLDLNTILRMWLLDPNRECSFEHSTKKVALIAQ